ncbi:MAG: glycosyltransferase family 4 protein [Blastocatellales bacterium]
MIRADVTTGNYSNPRTQPDLRLRPRLQTQSPAPAPKRILMTADTVGGVWTYALDLTRALVEYGVEVSLATMGAPLSPSQRAEAGAVANLEIFESDYKLEWMDDPWRDVRKAGEWLRLLEERIRPDIVHLNGYAHGALDFRAPVLMVGHSCVLSWWRAVLGCPAPAQWNQYRAEVACGLAAADIVIAPTRAMLGALEHHYGSIRDGRVVYNGRDASLFEVRVKDEFVITACRLWDEAKNIGALSRASSQILWPVLVAGDQRSPNGGVDGGVASTGRLHPLGRLSQRQIAGWFSRAAIYAAPARYEPFGLSALEAGLSGCALALGDIPSLREIWDGAAIFVPPDDVEALRDAIEELIENPRLRVAYGARARMRAQEFTSQRMAAGYLAAYSDLMTRTDKRAVAFGGRSVCA